MKKYVLLLLLMVVLAGCSGNSSPSNFRTFVGGTQGVELGFEAEAPPYEVIAGDPFFAVIVLENLGEHTIPASDYFVTLKGFSPDEFGVGGGAAALRTDGVEDLTANSLDPDTGEILESYPIYVQIPLDGQLAYGGTIAGNTQFPFVAEVCYTYQTVSNGQLCIKEDLQKPNDAEVCTINGAKAVSSSGAPVQISDLKEFAGGPNAVRFTFKVVAANTGGEVSERASECAETYLFEDRVYVTVDTGMAGDLSCSGFVGTGVTTGTTEGFVKLSGGSRQITCTQTVTDNEKADYVKAITITAEYDYKSSTQTNVLVKPIIA